MKVARGFLAFLVLLAVGAWLTAYAGQWILRWRAEKLLADIDSIQINRSSWADAETLIAKWRKNHEVSVVCGDEGCEYGLRYSHLLPPMLRGYPDEGVKNYWPRLTDHLGLRNETVMGSLREKDGILVERSFAEDVALPVRVWFDRGGAYVPDLAVWSGETARFDRHERALISPDARRAARNMKGPYGLGVSFAPNEDATERAALMDFRMFCLIQFSPCLSERDILPEGANVLGQSQARRSDHAPPHSTSSP